MKIHRTDEEKDTIAVICGALIAIRGYTLWETSFETEVPMSSLYKITMERLPSIDKYMYAQVRKVLEVHKHCGRKKSNDMSV
jgi:predicted transcriptional regulator